MLNGKKKCSMRLGKLRMNENIKRENIKKKTKLEIFNIKTEVKNSMPGFNNICNMQYI